MFSYEIDEIFKNTYFEGHLRATAFSSSSFKLDLIDLTVFPDLNLRLAKIKSFTTTFISSTFSRFCSHAFSFLCYQGDFTLGGISLYARRFLSDIVAT